MEKKFIALEKPISWLLIIAGFATIVLFLYLKFERNEALTSATILAFGTQATLIFYMPFWVNRWLPEDRLLPPPFNYFFSISLATFLVSILFKLLHFSGSENLRTVSTALLVPSFFFGVVQVVLRKVDGGWYLREKPFLIIGWIIIPLLEVLLAVSMGY